MMFVVAGPPGSGKSTAFPVSGFGAAFFNADDRAAILNRGSYAGISRQIRQQVNREFADFVVDCVNRHESFAIETTLRSQVTLEQARLAQSAGFRIEMRYLALEGFGPSRRGRPQRFRVSAPSYSRRQPAQSSWSSRSDGPVVGLRQQQVRRTAPACYGNPSWQDRVSERSSARLAIASLRAGVILLEDPVRQQFYAEFRYLQRGDFHQTLVTHI